MYNCCRYTQIKKALCHVIFVCPSSTRSCLFQTPDEVVVMSEDVSSPSGKEGQLVDDVTIQHLLLGVLNDLEKKCFK